MQVLQQLLDTDPLDHQAAFEAIMVNSNSDFTSLLESTRNDAQSIIDLVFDYIDLGAFEEAKLLIDIHHQNEIKKVNVPNPLEKSLTTKYILAWLYEQTGEMESFQKQLAQTKASSPDYYFPSRLEEQYILGWALAHDPTDIVASYGLGNFLYDKKRHQDAIDVWESVSKNNSYATLDRNLGIAYWNKHRDGEQALNHYQKALSLNPNDARIIYEYDQLRKKLNHKPEERLRYIEDFNSLILQRDDACVELASLYNLTGQSDKALNLLSNRRFHPWEGGEGKVLKEYTTARLSLGQIQLTQGNGAGALQHFQSAIEIPSNLGEKLSSSPS